MKAHEGEFQVRLMCRVLAVSRSGYYGWRGRKPSRQAQAREVLDADVRAAFAVRKGRAGSPRLARHLKKGQRQVAASLRRQGLRAKAAKKFKATTNSNHSLPVAENLLKQDFTAQMPNQVWVGDITYIGTDEGWLYLAVVMDLFSRKVVGWSLSERMTATLVCDALRMALFQRKMPRGVIMHTDRGSQYCSREHRALLEENQLIASMSAAAPYTTGSRADVSNNRSADNQRDANAAAAPPSTSPRITGRDDWSATRRSFARSRNRRRARAARATSSSRIWPRRLTRRA